MQIDNDTVIPFYSWLAMGISTIGELAGNRFVGAAQTITAAEPGPASRHYLTLSSSGLNLDA